MKIINLKGEVISESEGEDSEEDLPFSKASFRKEFVDRDKHKITELKLAVRDKNRVNVFLGSEFAFSLDIAQVVDFGLKVGQKLSDKEIKELERASEFGKLYTNTLEWVLTRPHSVKETRDHLKKKLYKRKIENRTRKINAERLKHDPELRLKQKEYKIWTKELKLYSEDDIEKVIERLVEKKYLNDDRFAEWFVENRCVKKGVSERQLRTELMKKGIDDTTINEVLAGSERNEEEEIKKVIRKKGRRNSPDKILRHLVTRGFSYELAKKLVEEYKENPEDF